MCNGLLTCLLTYVAVHEAEVASWLRRLTGEERAAQQEGK